MNTREVGLYWESNARAWTTLSRQGWDVYRDALNTPAFLALLPEIADRSGLDMGCGEGHNTRLLAARGARMVAIDLVPTFIEYAREAEHENPLGIYYAVAGGEALPFGRRDGRAHSAHCRYAHRRVLPPRALPEGYIADPRRGSSPKAVKSTLANLNGSCAAGAR